MKSNIFILSILIMCSCNTKQKSTSEGYSGKDISNEAQIVRNKHTKAATLEILSDVEWTLYSGNSPENINLTQPLKKGDGYGNFALDVSTNERSYFKFVTNEGSALLAERHLPMEGGFNFRDLGGYKTQDGKFVKWGKIFRSDDLTNLTDSDLRYLASIPILSVVDFRTQEEMNQAPDKLPPTAKRYPYTISPGNLTGPAATGDLSSLASINMDSIMMNINVTLVTDSGSIQKYKDFFKLLQNEENIPLLFHCSAGKDRTGMGAALILYALGVDEETIMKDYLLSNTYLADKYAFLTKQYPSLKPLFSVKKEFLQEGISQIKKDHGTVETYLEKVLNVDIKKFREMYLY